MQAVLDEERQGTASADAQHTDEIARHQDALRRSQEGCLSGLSSSFGFGRTKNVDLSWGKFYHRSYRVGAAAAFRKGAN